MAGGGGSICINSWTCAVSGFLSQSGVRIESLIRALGGAGRGGSCGVVQSAGRWNEGAPPSALRPVAG